MCLRDIQQEQPSQQSSVPFKKPTGQLKSSVHIWQTQFSIHSSFSWAAKQTLKFTKETWEINVENQPFWAVLRPLLFLQVPQVLKKLHIHYPLPFLFTPSPFFGEMKLHTGVCAVPRIIIGYVASHLCTCSWRTTEDVTHKEIKSLFRNISIYSQLVFY